MGNSLIHIIAETIEKFKEIEAVKTKFLKCYTVDSMGPVVMAELALGGGDAAYSIRPEQNGQIIEVSSVKDVPVGKIIRASADDLILEIDAVKYFIYYEPNKKGR